MKDNKKKCVFAGTFDPPTIGHEALIGDCLKLFDEVVVAIMVNPTKIPCFTVEERKEMLSLIFEKDNRIRITEFDGTVAELLEKEGTDVYVRGIRNGTDLDFEKYFMNDNVNDYYDNHIIVNKNYLCITPGITKGKWNRFAIKRLKKDNPEIEFENRPMESLGASVFQWVHDTLIGYFPSSLRIGIKKLLNKLTKKKFVTYK